MLFLSTVNPQSWELEHTRMHKDDHITKTIAYAVNHLQKNYTQAVANYDAAFEEMMLFATSLSKGIAKQFPQNFNIDSIKKPF